MRLIDADEVRLQKGFFEKVTNVPKFYEWLDSLPTVDAEPVRHGKWIEKRTYSGERPIGEWQSCKCSVCNRYDNRPYLYYFSEPNFCSWCGARMDGEE